MEWYRHTADALERALVNERTVEFWIEHEIPNTKPLYDLMKASQQPKKSDNHLRHTMPSIHEFIDFVAIIGDPPAYKGGFAQRVHIRGYRSKRKTIGVVTHENETIELKVPQSFTLADAKRYVDENGRDLLIKLNKMLDSMNPYKPAPLSYNSLVPFMGKDIPINVLPEGEEGDGYIRDNVVFLKPGLSAKEIKASVLHLIGEMAYGVFKEKIDYYAKAMDTNYYNLEINDGRRGFGSYNKDTGSVIFSRRLLMMSEAVIDALIVHELAHKVTLSHDDDFYNEILKILPDYDERDEEFNDTCRRLLELGCI
jgi:predicted metal-dependent hydrolase